MKSLTMTTEHYKENQDKVKSLACLQPMKKKNLKFSVVKHQLSFLIRLLNQRIIFFATC